MKNYSMYTSFVIASLEKEVATMKQRKSGYLKVDVGEMELLLSEIKEKNLRSISGSHEEYFCNTCTKSTVISRVEQYVIKPLDGAMEIRCLNCLIDTLKNDQYELEQLQAINWFLREHNLEEDFEAFRNELSYRENG